MAQAPGCHDCTFRDALREGHCRDVFPRVTPVTTWTHHCSIPASPAWSAPAHSAGQPLTPPTLAVSRCPCFQIHPEGLPPGPTCQSVRVPRLALLGRSQHHAPHKKGPPLPFLGLPGQRCPGHLHLLLLFLCRSSACSHTTHSADGSSPSVCVRAFAELELRAQPSGLFPRLGHPGLPRALLYMGTQGPVTQLGAP